MFKGPLKESQRVWLDTKEREKQIGRERNKREQEKKREGEGQHCRC